MNLFFRSATVAGIAAFVGGNAMPASAVYSTDYTPPKLAHIGKTSVAIAGSGRVVVKVLVKPNGSFQVMNVIRSTNPADNAAALDLARNSTYKPGMRGGKATTAFYDFTLKFNGKSYASADSDSAGSAGASGGGGQSGIARLLRAGNYPAAKVAATAYLTSHPGDSLAQSYLGLANALSGDDIAAAAAFDQVHPIPAQYRSVAAQAYSLAAVQTQSKDPAQAVSYAQKAMAIKADGNAYFALGVAQLASKDSANAVINLKKARDMARTDAKMTTKEKVAIDSQLMQAYLSTNDQTNAQVIGAEIKTLDPGSNASARVLAQADYNRADALSKAKNYPDSIKAWEAGAQADSEPASAVTGWAQAALLMGQLDKPDYKAMSAEADKAVAAKGDDPLANYAKGVALVNLGYQNKDEASKTSGKEYLTKADAEAKAANLTGLSLAIENFLKSIK
ncbi:MAG: energy transducer TonB [Candidatus Eremiobacteraeota bacterium]|nr:energy transducer TonB [Candidatus Eremiobacteraeota bacterium]